MKKITKREFDLLSPPNQDIIKNLGIEVEEDFKPEKASRRITDSCLSSYACVVETTCKLCKAVEVKVFLMEGTGGLLVSCESSIDKVEGMTVKTRTETVLTCSFCHDTLKLMSQEDLIALALKAAKGDCRCIKRN
jgi:hypothetical protein